MYIFKKRKAGLKMKKGKVLKTVGAAAVVAGSAVAITKVAKDKINSCKEQYEKDEAEARTTGQLRYNIMASDRTIIIKEQEIEGFDVKCTMSNVILNMEEQEFLEDAYLGFESHMSNVKIIVPENINVVVDVKGNMSKVKNNVVNLAQEEVKTLYIIGTATLSSVEVV